MLTSNQLVPSLTIVLFLVSDIGEVFEWVTLMERTRIAMSGIVTAESCWLNYGYWNFAGLEGKPTV